MLSISKIRGILLDASISDGAKLTLICLSAYSKNGEFSNGEEKLSELRLVKRRGLQLHLKELISSGYIQYTEDNRFIKIDLSSVDVGSTKINRDLSAKTDRYIEDWNRIYKTSWNTSSKISGLLSKCLDKYSYDDILSAMKKRKTVIMTDDFWQQSKLAMLALDPKHLIKNIESLESFLNANVSEDPDRLNDFKFD